MDKAALVDALDRILESIRAADQKAGFLLTLLGVLLAFPTPTLLVAERASPSPPLPPAAIVLAVLALGAYVLGLIWSVLVLFPRVHNISETHSLIYWGDVAGFTKASDYTAQVKSRTESFYLDDLASQVYVNSVIAKRKHESFKMAVRATGAGILLLIICYGIIAIW